MTCLPTAAVVPGDSTGAEKYEKQKKRAVAVAVIVASDSAVLPVTCQTNVRNKQLKIRLCENRAV